MMMHFTRHHHFILRNSHHFHLLIILLLLVTSSLFWDSGLSFRIPLHRHNHLQHKKSNLKYDVHETLNLLQLNSKDFKSILSQLPNSPQSQSTTSQSSSRQILLDHAQLGSVSPSAAHVLAQHQKEHPGENYVVRLADTFNVMYTAELYVGTPKQTARVVLDTGSSCLWFVSASSPLASQANYLHYYDNSKSSTYSPDGTDWAITYGVGQCHGFLSQDHVRLGDLIAENQTFAEATILSSNFLNPHQPLDGILGFAFPGGACSGWPTFLDSLYEQGQIDRKIFSFYLSSLSSTNDLTNSSFPDDIHEAKVDQNGDLLSDPREPLKKDDEDLRIWTNEDGGEIIIGEADGSLYEPPMVYTDVLHSLHKFPRMWFIRCNGISVPMSESSLVHGALRTKDTSAGQVPEDDDNDDTDSNNDNDNDSDIDLDLDRLSSRTGVSVQEEVNVDKRTINLEFCDDDDIPCVALPDTGTSFLTVPTRIYIPLLHGLTSGRDDCIMDRQLNVFCLNAPLGLPNITFIFSGKTVSLRPEDYTLPNRQLAIQVLDFGLPGVDVIILGDAFLRSVYTVFDADNLRVGFAQARKRNSSHSHSHHLSSKDSMRDDGEDSSSSTTLSPFSVWLINNLSLAIILVIGGLACLFFCFNYLYAQQYLHRFGYEAIPEQRSIDSV